MLTVFFTQASPYVTPLNVAIAVVSFIPLAIVLNVISQVFLPKDPSLPPQVFHWLPLFGSAAGYGHNPLKFFSDNREKYGDVFTFVLLGRKVTVCLSSKGSNFVLGGKSTVFNAEDAYKHFTTPVFGKDVVYDCPNELLMEQKKFVKYGLTTDHFRSYVGMMQDEVETFIKTDPQFSVYQQQLEGKASLDTWGTFDPAEVLAQIIILTACRTLQGKEIRSAMDKSFASLYQDLDGGFRAINFMFPNLPLESYRKRDIAQKKMSDFYVGIIKERKKALASGAQPEMDMMGVLMNQKYRAGRQLQDHEVAHIMIALLMAGQHTSASTSIWAMLRLANNPEIQKALYGEQVKHFGSPDGTFRDPTYEDLKDLPILDSVIRETLRMHPPIHSIMRKVRDDVPVPPSLSAPRGKGDSVFVIPKGYYVLASPLMAQLDPRIWKDASQFQPGRWLDPAGEAAQAYNTYVDDSGEKIDYGFGAVSKGTESPYQPFGAGRHRCIGEQFAYLQVGMVLGTLVRHLEFHIDKFPGNNFHTMITSPLQPRAISYRLRSKVKA
ncbi:cytochrome P450 [Fistulina hepatica ATCC 64428]|nr:cytochrome P450 [Fistulina hepatica ATCC 64428]